MHFISSLTRSYITQKQTHPFLFYKIKLSLKHIRCSINGGFQEREVGREGEWIFFFKKKRNEKQLPPKFKVYMDIGILPCRIMILVTESAQISGAKYKERRAPNLVLQIADGHLSLNSLYYVASF